MMSGDLLPRAGGRLMFSALPQKKAAPRALLTLAVLLMCRGFDSKEQEGLILGFLSRSLDQRFSLLELVGDGENSHAAQIASRFPAATVVRLSSAPLPGFEHRGDGVVPRNLYSFIISSNARQADQINMLHDSPTVFSATIALAVSPETFRQQQGAQLLGVSRCLLLSRGALEMRQAKAQILSAAAAGGVTVADISPLGEYMLKVSVGHFSRAVRHHFADNRRCPMRGYLLTYTAAAASVSSAEGGALAPGRNKNQGGHPRLERLKYGLSRSSAKKGGTAHEAFGCMYTNQHKGPVLTQPSWVNLFTLSGLGLASAAAPSTRRRLVNSVLELPHFDDGVPWNACVDGPTVTWCDMDFKGGGGHSIKAEALSLECNGGRDWQELKTPPCILDMMLIAVFGCGPVGFEQLRDGWFGGSGNKGHHPKGRPITSTEMNRCRELHGFTAANV